MSIVEKWRKMRKSSSVTEETPAEETPAVETPEAQAAAETPAEETVVEAPAEEAAAAETPGAKAAAKIVEAPAEEAAASETPEEETPAQDIVEEVLAEEVSAEETPLVEEAVAEEAPVEEAPVEEEAATEEAPAEEIAAEVPAEETPVVEETAEVETPAEEIAAEAAAEEKVLTGLDALEPADVFRFFREISAIPHGSFHTAAISSYLEDFAKSHDFSYIRDDLGNVIISKPASAGCESAAPIALQGHIDMVCEKEASNPIDMEKEAITLRTDGEWLSADRTTLGGDDGIAVAMMLALLDDASITCPPLECVFTVDEEVGLLGAYGLDLSSLRSRRMINLDSEDEGVITASCAGGAEVICTLSGKRREKNGEILEIRIEGLRGGHSGERINCGRANADLLMARLLCRLQEKGKFCIIGFNGGNRDNAIPRECRAEIIFTGKFSRSEIKEAVASFADDIAKEYSVTDPDIHVSAKWPNKGRKALHIAFGRKDSRRMIRLLMAFPNGVIEYSPLYKDVPQTSLSMGIVKTMADGICIHSMVRSSINSQKQMMLDRIACIAEEFDASIDIKGTYPAWELIEKSDFRDLAAEVYEKLTGIKPVVCVIHGGLECGLLAAKVPGLDCISIGPDMEEVHTPAERLNIPSSKRTYDYLKVLLAACAEA